MESNTTIFQPPILAPGDEVIDIPLFDKIHLWLDRTKDTLLDFALNNANFEYWPKLARRIMIVLFPLYVCLWIASIVSGIIIWVVFLILIIINMIIQSIAEHWD